MTKTLVLCDCLGSQPIDAAKLSGATDLETGAVMTDACGAQIERTAHAMAGGDTVIACAQMARLFEDLAAEIEAAPPACVDIRDRAGWTAPGERPAAKMAALLAESLIPVPSEKTRDVVSQGTCLVIGGAEAAQRAAQDLGDTLAVTLLTPEPVTQDLPPNHDIVAGRLARVSGSLGRFDLRIDAFQQPVAGGRGARQWTAPKDKAQSHCDIILDLSGDVPLFSAPQKRDGYLRADPGSLPAVADAVFKAAQLTGTFEKPLYIRLEEQLCAHSRAGQTACTKCLDICPTGAISPDGENVSIDPMICAGCGACAALCPSGAITYDAPPVDVLFRRMSTLAGTYRKAGGRNPRLLVHDAEFGTEMISLAARHGRGLPADVIPLSVSALAGFGHAEMLAALACGFARVDILAAPTTERDVIETEMTLARAVADPEAVRLLDLSDPDALSDTLYDTPSRDAVAEPMLPIGSRRQVSRLAAKALRPEAEVLDLPQGAPYGAVVVDQDACTLCLSCVSLCPSGALGDNPDNPQLRFQQDACLQCGLCSTICPEDAITLKPEFDLTDAALHQKVLHEEEPFACVECGTLFGVKSTVERITEKLAGNHAMFANPQAVRMIQMCDNCRIQAQYHSENNPFAGAPRPKVRTTEDYLSKRKDH